MTTSSPTSTITNNSQISKKFYLACWRWHFYAGLFVIPFLIILAASGLAMMYVAYIDGRDGELIPVAAVGEPSSITILEQHIQAKFSDAQITEIIIPETPNLAYVFRIKLEDASQQWIGINQYSNEVIQSWDRRDGWYDWLSSLHGELLIGTVGDRIMELAACFAMLLIATGAYLWWSKINGLKREFVVNLKLKKRSLFKSIHQTIGLYSAGLLVLFLLSGLSWSGIWGGEFVQAWNSFPAEKWGDVPLSDDTHDALNYGATKDVPWGLELTPMPASTIAETTLAGASITNVMKLADHIGIEGRYHINYPSSATGVWTLSQDSMSNDSDSPTTDRTVHIDQYSFNILADVRYEDYSLMAKAMAVGIALHEGDMGLINLAVNTLFCVSIILLCVTGVIMWWYRKPNMRNLMAAPQLPADMPMWKLAAGIMLLLSLLFPLMGITLAALLLLDVLILQRFSFFKSPQS